MYIRHIKHIIGFVISLFMLIAVLPLMLVICLLLYVFNNREIVFRQERVGYKGKPFIVYKFKTMNDKTDRHGNLLSDAKRTTLIGRILRKTSLDELPQLINILKGDMNLIGPRPLLKEHIKDATPEQNRRFDIKPGVTGWAQVNGRNTIAFSKRFDYDVYYVDNCNFWFDIKIMGKTIFNVLKMNHPIH